ncbi:MAG: hypothetical protein MJ065_08030 [Oscillospiraceae bacterium]|nr:hypothetical protein [Oscillospiraceae bacterium]
MKTIRILSESAALGKRLRDILYQAGYTDIVISDLSAKPLSPLNEILIIYAKAHIPGVIQAAADCRAQTILLLNPDCYAMYLERARHAGITPLLMPVAPEMLLDTVLALDS